MSSIKELKALELTKALSRNPLVGLGLLLSNTSSAARVFSFNPLLFNVGLPSS